MFSFTLDIYCTSVHPGRGIPHMWLSLRFLLSFYLLKGFFSSFSLLLLRVKDRGCHTLLKPYETNCDLWIWAIQIQFDWLIDSLSVVATVSRLLNVSPCWILNPRLPQMMIICVFTHVPERTSGESVLEFAFYTWTTQQEIVCADLFTTATHSLQDSGDGWCSRHRQDVTYYFRCWDHMILFTAQWHWHWPWITTNSLDIFVCVLCVWLSFFILGYLFSLCCCFLCLLRVRNVIYLLTLSRWIQWWPPEFSLGVLWTFCRHFKNLHLHKLWRISRVQCMSGCRLLSVWIGAKYSAKCFELLFKPELKWSWFGKYKSPAFRPLVSEILAHYAVEYLEGALPGGKA